MRKYEQIQQYILTEINDGRLRAMNLIASEKALGEKFQVSRMTVRKAIDNLVALGILFRVQGKGTFVSSLRRIKEFNRFKSFSEQATEAGLLVSTIVINFNEIFPDAAIASVMNLETKEKVYRIDRVRMADGIPLAYEESYFLFSVLGTIKPEVANGSIFKYLEEVKHVKIGYANQDFDAVSADNKLAIMLNVPLNTPLLRQTCIGHTQSDLIFEYTRTYYRCDRYIFSQISIRDSF